MINLKTEEFVLEMTTLQSLQQLIQWVGDFVLYLLASLPNQVRARRAENRPRGAKKICVQCSGGFSRVMHDAGVPVGTDTWEKSVRNSRNTKWSVPCPCGSQWCSDWQLHSVAA